MVSEVDIANAALSYVADKGHLACPKITCDVCNKLVERVEIYMDVVRNERVYKVWCHGDKDECRIPDTVFLENRAMDFVEGRAFTTKRITGPESGSGDRI